MQAKHSYMENKTNKTSSSISITGGLVKKCEYGTSPQTFPIKDSIEWGLRQLCLLFMCICVWVSIWRLEGWRLHIFINLFFETVFLTG